MKPATVYATMRAAVAVGQMNRTPGEVTRPGIDEISRKKGLKYLTQVYDLSTRTSLWRRKGSKENTLREFCLLHQHLAETVTAV